MANKTNPFRIITTCGNITDGERCGQEYTAATWARCVRMPDRPHTERLCMACGKAWSSSVERNIGAGYRKSTDYDRTKDHSAGLREKIAINRSEVADAAQNAAECCRNARAYLNNEMATEELPPPPEPRPINLEELRESQQGLQESSKNLEKAREEFRRTDPENK